MQQSAPAAMLTNSANHRKATTMRNSSRTWLDRENAGFAATIKPGSKVLDAGAGEQPYKRHFSHCFYEAADFEKVDKQYAHSTYVCDLSSIPVEDGRFDAVVFNQVLEHIPRPDVVLRELYRTMKVGGTMICTAPLFYAEHEQPYDFYRYTQFGLRFLLAGAGFNVKRIYWMEGYYGTIGYQLESAATLLPLRPSLIAPGIRGWFLAPIFGVCKTLFALLARVFYWLDESHRFTSSGMPKNYVAIVEKT